MAFAALGDGERAWELTTMINPVNHARTPEDIAKYKAEPYVVAADVYALAPHTGRGGWSWYTGSAGWMYRLIVESLLGVTLETDRLRVTPCLPADWTGFSMRYRYRGTQYDIVVRQTPALNRQRRTPSRWMTSCNRRRDTSCRRWPGPPVRIDVNAGGQGPLLPTWASAPTAPARAPNLHSRRGVFARA
jgi:hypothetical protein